jgi:PAS domain S-box-containing protein
MATGGTTKTIRTQIPSPVIPARRDEEWRSFALECAQMRAYQWDLKTDLIFRSDPSAREPGIDPDSDSWIYSEGSVHIHPEDRSFVETQIQEAIDSRQNFNIEFRTSSKREHVGWLQAKGRAVYDAKGVAIRVFSVTQDITQRKQDELTLQNQKRELEAAKENLKTALDVAGMAAIAGIPFPLKVKSPELCRLLGIEDEDTGIDQEVAISRMHPDDREKTRAQLRETVESGGPIEREYRVLLRDGKIRWIMAKGASIQDERGREPRRYLILQDITKRKEVEEQLKQKNIELESAQNKIVQTSAILNSIMASSPDIIYVKDRSARMVFCNPITLNNIAKSAEEIYGKNDVEFLGTGNGGEEILRTDERIMSTGVGETAEEWVTWRDGRKCLYMSQKVPQRNATGEVIGLIGISRDITERKKHEEQIKQKNHELSLVNEKLDRFSGVVAHDLKNPLASIAMQADLLSRTQSMESASKCAHFIKFVAMRMAHLIDELLQFAKSDQHIPLPKEPVSLSNLIETVQSNLTAAILHSHAKIEVSRDLPDVFGYPPMLLQLFQNLISNALKFRSEREPELAIVVRELQDHWLISIKDNGVGIDPAQVDRLFGPFERADSKIEGTGLGLSICKTIVERHGGKIWIESKLGVGSEFSLTLSKR